MAKDNENVDYIDRAELQALFGRGERVVIVDVRSPSEFAEGHLDGAVNIPADQLRARVQELPIDATVVTVCAKGGARSCSAAALLRESGISTARPLRGGALG